MGSLTLLFAATAPEIQQDKEKYTGVLVFPFGVPCPEDETQDAKNPALAAELWATTEKILADILYK